MGEGDWVLSCEGGPAETVTRWITGREVRREVSKRCLWPTITLAQLGRACGTSRLERIGRKPPRSIAGLTSPRPFSSEGCIVSGLLGMCRQGRQGDREVDQCDARNIARAAKLVREPARRM